MVDTCMQSEVPSHLLTQLPLLLVVPLALLQAAPAFSDTLCTQHPAALIVATTGHAQCCWAAVLIVEIEGSAQCYWAAVFIVAFVGRGQCYATSSRLKLQVRGALQCV